MTITVGKGERYAGSGSKQTTVTGSGTIMQIESNLAEDFVHTAVVENLIIDGQNQSGTTGILLQNVGNAIIRNITIKNCDTGILLNNYYGAWTEVNCLRNIRMENVKKGIMFNTDGYFAQDHPGSSFGVTFIDDLGISLKNDSTAVGIQVGDGYYAHGGSGTWPNGRPLNAAPYNSFIKANIWLGSAGGTGLKILNGELKYGLINLAVQGSGSGTGIDLSQASGDPNSPYYETPIEKNQTANPATNIKGFLLYAEGLATPINNSKGYNITDVTKVPP